MEDRKIKALEDAGSEYADIRDQRIELNKQEAALKKRVRSLMHKHDKTTYESGDIMIELEPPDGEETVKVRVKKQKVTRMDVSDGEAAEA